MNDQFIRKASLFVRTGEDFLDLSDFRIKFETTNTDFESPNTLVIRIYNLAAQTIQNIRTQISKSSTDFLNKVNASNGIISRDSYFDVVLNAGYENGNFGIIFQGQIKQFKIGRENNKDSYLDLYAADGDYAQNNGVINQTIAPGTSIEEQTKQIVANMPGLAYDGLPKTMVTDAVHGVNIRGKTLAGMSKAYLRNTMKKLDLSWSIENGKLLAIPITGYRIGEAVEINVTTGLIGLPEQTDNGIKIKSLLNSSIRIGGLIKLNNNEIPELTQSNPLQTLNFNSFSNNVQNVSLSKDGIYRAYSVEHEGDTRGQQWYSTIVCLAVDTTGRFFDSVKP